MQLMVDTDVSGLATLSTSVTVLCLEEDESSRAKIQESLSGNGFEVRAETPPVAVCEALDGVDCVVCGPTSADGNGDDLLRSVRDHRPQLPVVFVADGPPGETDLGRPDQDRVVVLSIREATTDEQLPEWADLLAGHYRTTNVARRALAAMEASGEGFAIVEPDGRFEVVDRTFATRFGYRVEDMVGRPWETYFPDWEVDRLRSDAFPIVREDWQWFGGCVGRRADGESFTAETRINGLDDGSLVFCVSGPDDERHVTD